MAIDVASWLQQLGLAQYEPAFRDNEVDGDVLPDLTAEDLIADDHRPGGDADPHRELDPGGTPAFSSAIAPTMSRPARTERSASSS